MKLGRTRIMVVGIGSPNGDDRAGWRVIDLLSSRIADICQLRSAKVPHELIDWIGDTDVLHVVDACEADDHSTVSRYQVTADDHDVSLLSKQNGKTATLPRLRSSNTHQLDFRSVVQLASQLQKLPSDLTLWTIPGQAFGPGEVVHQDCEAQIRCCADMIARELASGPVS